MKFRAIGTFVFLAFGTGVSVGQGLSDCTIAVKKVLNTFTTDEVEASVESLLKKELCGDGNPFPDLKECEASISKRWPHVTSLLMEQADVFAYQSCNQAIPIKLDWNCRTCRYRILGLLNTLRSTEFFAVFRDYALGPAYCEDGNSTSTEVETCQNWIITYVPKAFLILRITPLEDICNELYGLCPGEIGCREGMEEMIEQMGNDTTIARTEEILKEQVCTQSWVHEAGGCETAVELYWEKMAKTLSLMSPNFISVCNNYYDLFEEPSPGDKWNCGTCQKRMREVMRFHLNHQIDWVVAAVSQIINSDLCKGSQNSEADTVICEQAVRAFIPRALQVLMDDANNNPDKLCRNIFNFDETCQYIDSGTTPLEVSALVLLVSTLLGLKV